MSQSGLTDATQLTEWDAWYVEHLRIMRTVKGINSAERFTTDKANWPPSLAMYTIESAKVFHDPYYQKIRGMGPWLELIDKRYYRRNLFSGLDIAPAVADDEVLLVTDQTSIPTELIFFDIPFIWLTSVGLDQSTPFRGIAVIKTTLADQIMSQTGGPIDVAVYKPTKSRE